MARTAKAAKKVESFPTAPEPASTQEPVNTATPEGISLNDLSTLKQIVDVATQRGAFRGGELSQVGAVYDKLTAFLTYVEEQQKAIAEANKEKP